VDLDALLPNVAVSAAASLRANGLAYDEAGRLRCLAPIREYVARAHAPADADLRRTVGLYVRLAREKGSLAGKPRGAEAIARLAPEWANVAGMIQRGLGADDPCAAIDGALGLRDFVRFTGVGDALPLSAAREAAGRTKDAQREAEASFALGVIASDRSDHEGARAQVEAALPLYRRVGDVLGEANCIQRLGDIALERSDHEGARAQYEAALPLFRRFGDVLGEANCIQRLGDIALARSDHEGARAQVEAALPLYRRVESVLGEANCIQRLGDIALARSDHEGARAQYEAALPLYRRVGDVLGEANCIRSLGDIALRRSDHEGARAQYEAALPLYRRVGSVLGEANCIRSLGDIANAEGDSNRARDSWNEALRLYGRIPEPYSIGWAHVRLARIAKGQEEKVVHLEAARLAWESIKRPDLVKQLEEEFGELAKG
jgi:tetratricopeptide (TPR) repeat protein